MKTPTSLAELYAEKQEAVPDVEQYSSLLEAGDIVTWTAIPDRKFVIIGPDTTLEKMLIAKYGVSQSLTHARVTDGVHTYSPLYSKLTKVGSLDE